MKKYNLEPTLYPIFRILVGLGFLLHGGMKLFGWFSDKGPVQLMSLFGLAGVIELVAGLFILLGFFSCIAAFFGAIDMIGAWVVSHTGIMNGALKINPLTNGGELAMLYLAAFLVIIAKGSGKLSLERAIFGKEFFH
ncbi:DoxX family protein [Candidatus Pacearchaeota archaeon CG10_big_fil_rev_8_21_14_0_10_32_14]|nr:MAG: DoxX family protein [Candidatus Pacearchaeota archaeon CG10_big_fil_rev_8_21_14_0_10_32_14]